MTMSSHNFKFQVVGTIRDVAHVFERELLTVKNIFNNFGSVKMFLVESDSLDSSVEILENLQETLDDFSFISLGELEGKISNRLSRIAYCREVYLNYVREHCQDMDFIVVVDLDGMNSSLSTESVGKTLELVEHWDAVFANQGERYYDIGALRHKYWSPNDCFKVMEWANLITDRKSSRLLAIQSRMMRISPSAGLIPVDSAYGGLAIYKTRAFVRSTYIGNDEYDQPQLDFVTFNLKLREMGFRLFIDSQLINNNFNSHNAGSNIIYRFLKLAARRWESNSFKRKIKQIIISLISR